jgi:hypothetical protein
MLKKEGGRMDNCVFPFVNFVPLVDNFSFGTVPNNGRTQSKPNNPVRESFVSDHFSDSHSHGDTAEQLSAASEPKSFRCGLDTEDVRQ